ncbi:T6SS immunity protein Tli4 family protein [Paraburkholderia sp.]|uniref:T6SS immunity protein Tli4 family protein n=1 Tax=Paraburkholderia sp. TaxID=1926495 RepID=UPI00286F64DE|nr:T6SS immunity protein Tli4 family protein [Paraburkholderia sp.]
MNSARIFTLHCHAKNTMTARPGVMRRFTATVLFVLTTTHVLAAPQEECVGRYRLTLPSEADVALTTAKAFVDEQDVPIRFADGLGAQHSSFVYDGSFEISDSVSQNDFDAQLKRAKAQAMASAAKPRADQRYTLLPVSGNQNLAWSSAKASGFYTYKNGTAVSFVTRSVSEQHAVDVLRNVRARASGEIPTTPGVCLPGLFVEANEPDEVREVGATFRLKAHPDVLIFFRDLKVLRGQPRLTSRQENEFIWTGAFAVGKAVKLHGVFPWRSVKLDGREGVGSFGTITRADNSTDYGYLVTVQGDLDAPTDTPDLLLYVERNASASQGKTPVTADEIEKIGEEIAASIKRR